MPPEPTPPDVAPPDVAPPDVAPPADAVRPADALQLAEYRREVAEAYADARRGGAGEGPWRTWRIRRDRLFATHPQSPVPAERRGPGWTTPFAPYDPAWRVVGRVQQAPSPTRFDVPHGDSGTTTFLEVGVVRAEVPGASVALPLLWLDAYGGGLFLPFRDATAGRTTYGGGRYLLDTVKGADLGGTGAALVLDFNYAYHPSCAWDARWSCPLAMPASRLDVAVEAGELLPLGHGGGGSG